jgi:small subunit ribosomal protein S6
MATKVVKRQYELTYLVSAGYTETELKNLKDEVAKLIAKHKGEITDTQDWGKKKLAYKIRHASVRHEQAAYVMHAIDLAADEAQALDRAMQLHPSIIRHLLVKVA